VSNIDEMKTRKDKELVQLKWDSTHRTEMKEESAPKVKKEKGIEVPWFMVPVTK